MSTSRTARQSRPNLTSLLYSLPVRRLKNILVHVAPNITLGAVNELHSTQLTRLYKLNMSDERNLLLSFAPSLAVRLLRQEGQLLSSEAALINFISRSETRESGAGSKCENKEGMSLELLVPRLLKHSSNNREMAYPYSIFEEPAGQPLSTLAAHLSGPERRDIDRQIGAMTKALAALTSPNGTFGAASRVFTEPNANTTAGPQAPAVAPKVGFKTWSEAFNALLEGILRDGEDISVLLPYDVIRARCERLSWHLDAITLPRLTILDIGSEANVMVSYDKSKASSSGSADAKITGLRSWAQGVFGDPLIADVFTDPSEGFLEGWRGEGRTMTEGEENADVRMMLYRCYKAVVAIVTEHYRPQPDSSQKELKGRRKLTSVLAELEKTDAMNDGGGKRSRSPSGFGEEASKRPKLESDTA
ncbi:hypothetical protein GLAREA_02905 [Glarea lozoyensis ATCC 20868]|uniref:Aminoglycoside phosphotransferase domain-containing protein n=1 Tax=Glarea lozoyensis (strain ATCC 20868 / MF5171) TaxID=1116229 RepID=S3D4I7_GLAL2|nr:uncharacterized protein GLAREA_02905 [Glarea lozoyensis ATCC 20868]EPE26991.1 hypothetical protein GLAREA_02905 [Glarea lozoyensis ATCC 20868]